MKILAIIPARAGSKGIKNKNIVELAGQPLIHYTIKEAEKVAELDRIIVSTENELIKSVCDQIGDYVPFMRPVEFAQDHSPDRGHTLHAMNWFKENEGSVPEYWVHLRATTPLRNPHVVDEAIQKIQNDSDSTSLRSGHPAPESPCKWFQRDDHGYFIGNCPEDKRPEYYNLPRQLFPDVYIPDGYVDILKSSFVLSSESLNGDKMLGFVSPHCHEVDTLEELEMIEYQLKKKGSPLLDYLKTTFN